MGPRVYCPTGLQLQGAEVFKCQGTAERQCHGTTRPRYRPPHGPGVPSFPGVYRTKGPEGSSAEEPGCCKATGPRVCSTEGPRIEGARVPWHQGAPAPRVFQCRGTVEHQC